MRCDYASFCLYGHIVHKILLGIGGNLGDVPSCIRIACDLLCRHIERLRLSPLYETQPHFDKPGAAPAPVPNYINAAVSGFTSLSPSELLIFTQAIENKLGRVRSIPCAPRTLDIDILLYDDAVIDTPDLTIPHPRMHERNFVLVPAADIESEWVHPICATTIAELRDSCLDVLAFKACRD